jgi:hypothetical protein
MSDESNAARDHADRQVRAKIRLRHERAAERGVHLPSVKELILGSPFMSKDIRIDAAAFADRTVGRIRTDTDTGQRVRAALETLMASSELEVFVAVATPLQSAMLLRVDGTDIPIELGIDTTVAATAWQTTPQTLGLGRRTFGSLKPRSGSRWVMCQPTSRRRLPRLQSAGYRRLVRTARFLFATERKCPNGQNPN